MTTQARIKNIEKKLGVLRNLSATLHVAATEALTELAEIQQAPAKRKKEEVNQYALDMAMGTIRKPMELRKSFKPLNPKK
jgi:hypothetical protein